MNSEFIPAFGVHACILPVLQGVDRRLWYPVLRFLRTTTTLGDLAGDPENPPGFRIRQNYTDNILFALGKFESKLYQKYVAGLRMPQSVAEAEVTKKLFGSAVRGSVDSFPINCCNGEWNGHYKAKIKKALIVITHRGLFEDVFGPYKGTDYDDTLLNLCPEWKPAGLNLGDQHFSGPHIVKGTNHHIIKKTLADGKDVMGALRESERVGYLRARVEHLFAVFPRIQHFGRLSAGRLLHLALRVAVAILNIETLMTKEDGNRYVNTAITEEWRRDIEPSFNH